MNKATLRALLKQSGVKCGPDDTIKQLEKKLATAVVSTAKPTVATPSADAPTPDVPKKKAPKMYSTERVQVAELVQKALGVHPDVKVQEGTLVATYSFPGDVEEIREKVKRFKEKAVKEAEEQRELEKSLAVT